MISGCPFINRCNSLYDNFRLGTLSTLYSFRAFHLPIISLFLDLPPTLPFLPLKPNLPLPPNIFPSDRLPPPSTGMLGRPPPPWWSLYKELNFRFCFFHSFVVKSKIFRICLFWVMKTRWKVRATSACWIPERYMVRVFTQGLRMHWI